LDIADAAETPVAGRRKLPFSTGLGSVPAATEFTNFFRDIVGITQAIAVVAPMLPVKHKGEVWMLAHALVAQSDTVSPLWGLLDV